MPIAEKLKHHLARRHVQFDMTEHQLTKRAMDTAAACHVSPDSLAKAVVVRTRDGYCLAILPASQRLSLARLQPALSRPCALATEKEIDRLFDDCVSGAIPPVGECYGLDVIAEASIFEQPDIYFEGGDHMTLVHMSQAQFTALNEDARRARFTAAFE
jgi:Ala-tRNA(Pro) deacylase